MANMYLKTEPITMPITGEGRSDQCPVHWPVMLAQLLRYVHLSGEYIKEQEREDRRIDQLNLFR